MAAVFQAAGTHQVAIGAAANANDLTVAWPTHAVDDIALLWVVSPAESNALTTANGFVQVTDVTGGAASSFTGQRTSVYWCRATSTSMASPVVANPNASGGNSFHLAVITTYRGCVTSGDPFDVFGSSAATVASATVTIPSVTTTVVDTLLAMAWGGTRDAAYGPDSAGPTFTNAALTGSAPAIEVGTTAGNGGSLNIGHGSFAGPGATGTSTASTISETQGRLIVALKTAIAAIDGTATITEADDTLSAAGTVTASVITGTAAITEAGDTSTSAGALPVQGALTATEAGDTSTSAGSVNVVGVAALVEAGDTLTSAGNVLVLGSLAKTEAGDTVGGAGAVLGNPYGNCPLFRGFFRGFRA